MKVLVVDDKAPNRKLLCRSLEKLGYQAIEAVDGSDAIAQCQSELPDLILMDIMMPGIDGMQAADRIRQLPGGGEISIIFVTAVREDQGLIEALESGGDDYVTKPVDLAVLHAKIKAQQRTRQLSRQLAEQNAQLARHNRELQRDQQIIDHFFSRIDSLNFVPPELLRYHANSATTFSGDLLLSARRPAGGIYLMVGDFTGHGLSAAMGSLPVAEMFTELTDEGHSVGTIARRINRLLVDYLPPEIFLAATLVELDASGTLLQYWAGGLPNGILLHMNGHLMPVCSQHMPLGILSDPEFSDAVVTCQVETGARLLLMTDGITEATNPSREIFGEARVQHTLESLKAHDDALAKLQRAVLEFSDSGQIQDDVVVAELFCHPLPAPIEPTGRNSSRDYPTEFSFEVNAEDLVRGGVPQRAVDLLCALPAARVHRGELHTVVSELVSNAIDHGLLRIESGERHQGSDYENRRVERLRSLENARLTLSTETRQDAAGWYTDIRVCHNGPPHRVDIAEAGGEDAQQGRGLLILEALCEEVRIDRDSLCTCARYRFH